MNINRQEGKLHLLLKRLIQIKLRKSGYHYVFEEVGRYPYTAFDAVGISNSYYMEKVKTIAIEVKTSRSDYRSKKQKSLGFYTAKGNERFMHYREQIGVHEMYFLTPAGLIKPLELYLGWGLMEWDGKQIKTIVKAPRIECSPVPIIYSMMQTLHATVHMDWTGIVEDMGRLLTYQEYINKFELNYPTAPQESTGVLNTMTD